MFYRVQGKDGVRELSTLCIDLFDIEVTVAGKGGAGMRFVNLIRSVRSCIVERGA